MTAIEDAENTLLELSTEKRLLENNLDEARKKMKTATGENKAKLQNQIRGLEKRIGDVKHVHRATDDLLKTMRRERKSGGTA